MAAVGHTRESAKRETAERGTPGDHRKIIFTTSSAALVGNRGQANYTVATRALIGLTRTLARELGCYGRPEDVAGAHMLLASSEADDVTGPILPVTGEQLGT